MAWESLISIIKEAEALAAQDAVTPPVACPNDFTTLLAAPDGGLYCPWDGWLYPQDA